MKNMRKIGMTALAASLVSTSAFAGAVTVSGGASIGLEGYSGTSLVSQSGWSMGNELTFTGSGTLDNGLNVALSMEIDQGKASALNPYEAQSLTLSRDDIGKLVFAGVDGNSAGSSIAKTAAGNIWDNFDTTAIEGSVAGAARLTGGATNNSFLYTSPELTTGLKLFGSFNPHGSHGSSYMGYGVTYTGIAGLTFNAAIQDIEKAGADSSTDGDHRVFKASYAFGPLTVSASDNDYEQGSGTVSSIAAAANVGQKTRSYAIAYTVSEGLSVNFGTEVIDAPTGSDAEFQTIGASYTMGGMTLSASMQDAENINHSTSATADQEYWSTGISFAF